MYKASRFTAFSDTANSTGPQTASENIDLAYAFETPNRVKEVLTILDRGQIF